MKRISLFIALFAFTVATTAITGAQTTSSPTKSIQTISATVGTVGQLESLPTALAAKSVEACGPYFTFTGDTKDATKAGLVTFMFTSTDSKSGVKNTTIPMYATDKLQIRKVAGLKTPTVKVLQMGGPVYPWVEIAISPEELQQAKCLTSHSRVKIVGASTTAER